MSALSGTVMVFAASSLTDAFKEEATAFQAAHGGVHVSFNFAGSPTLVAQLEQGAQADVLATADEQNMHAALSNSAVIDAGQTFAHNVLVVIVPKSNPGGIASPLDLAKPGLKLVLAQEGVPAGTYARQSLAKFDGSEGYPPDFDARVLKNLVSNEPNVKAVAAKVQLGEADAGIVYTTDVTPGVAQDVRTVAIPDAYNVVASYPIALTSDASDVPAARVFIDFVLSAQGQAILRKYGFRGA
jgi:molybdate transport system substrate-binding protein